MLSFFFRFVIRYPVLITTTNDKITISFYVVTQVHWGKVDMVPIMVHLQIKGCLSSIQHVLHINTGSINVITSFWKLNSNKTKQNKTNKQTNKQASKQTNKQTNKT